MVVGGGRGTLGHLVLAESDDARPGAVGRGFVLLLSCVICRMR